jgi:hypothetical protein
VRQPRCGAGPAAQRAVDPAGGPAAQGRGLDPAPAAAGPRGRRRCPAIGCRWRGGEAGDRTGAGRCAVNERFGDEPRLLHPRSTDAVWAVWDVDAGPGGGTVAVTAPRVTYQLAGPWHVGRAAVGRQAPPRAVHDALEAIATGIAIKTCLAKPG